MELPSQKYSRFFSDLYKTFCLVSDPFQLVRKNVSLSNNILNISGQKFYLDKFNKIGIVSLGKCSVKMFSSWMSLLGGRIDSGFLVSEQNSFISSKNVTSLCGDHPYPGKKSLQAGKRLYKFLQKTGKNDLLITNISGGTSAMVVYPVFGVTIDELKKLNYELLKSGATIAEINCVRKHLSQIKGGRSLKIAEPGLMISMLISDTHDSSPSTIGSGLFSPDDKSFSDALDVVDSYNLSSKIPASITEYLTKSIKGEIKETFKSECEVYSNSFTKIIGTNMMVLENLKEQISNSGIHVTILAAADSGEVRKKAEEFAGFILHRTGKKKGPQLFLTGGEYSVKITGTGKGGRNTEFVLAVLKELRNFNEEFFVFSFGSDGIDGPTDAAGAWIDEKSFSRSKEIVDGTIGEYLNKNDSYTFFDKMGQLIKTGRTGTNVMDIRGVFFP